MQNPEENSIFAALEGNTDSFVSTARQEIDSPDVEDRLFCIVEGKDDEGFYSSFINPDNAKLYYPKGCEKVRIIISELNPLYPNKLFGIVDADFFTLNNLEEDQPNIFRTEWHDHEMWLIYKEGNLTTAYNDFKILAYHHAEILPRALKGLKCLSYIKWYHDHKKRTELLPDGSEPAGLDFRNSAMEQHFSKTIEESLNYLYAHQETPEEKIQISVKEVEEFMKLHPDTDPKHLNVGHDLLNAITFIMKKFTTKTIKKNDLYIKLAENYTLDDFKTTILYNDINNYFSLLHIASPFK